MPCDDPNHVHEWPDSGLLNIERCERYCSYCHGHRRSKAHPNATILRKHAVKHVKPGANFENVVIKKGKGGRPAGHKMRRRRIQGDGPGELPAFRLEARPYSRRNDWPAGQKSRPRHSSEDEEEEEENKEEEEGDDSGSHRKVESRSPEPQAITPRLTISRTHERGAKRRAQEQIKTSYALPLEYVPSPSPEPMEEDEGDDGIMYSEDEISASVNRPPAHRSIGSWHRRSSGPVPRTRENRSTREAVLPTRIATQPARKPNVSDRSRTSSMPHVQRASQAPATRSRTPEPLSEDDEPGSPPQPSLEAQIRIRQHIQRIERELESPRHPKSGKRPVIPRKDYSQLWLKEFEPDT